MASSAADDGPAASSSDGARDPAREPVRDPAREPLREPGRDARERATAVLRLLLCAAVLGAAGTVGVAGDEVGGRGEDAARGNSGDEVGGDVGRDAGCDRGGAMEADASDAEDGMFASAALSTGEAMAGMGVALRAGGGAGTARASSSVEAAMSTRKAVRSTKPVGGKSEREIKKYNPQRDARQNQESIQSVSASIRAPVRRPPDAQPAQNIFATYKMSVGGWTCSRDAQNAVIEPSSWPPSLIVPMQPQRPAIEANTGDREPAHGPGPPDPATGSEACPSEKPGRVSARRPGRDRRRSTRDLLRRKQRGLAKCLSPRRTSRLA
jgi:hypothetical protein